jgi:hypothetical protein
MDHQSAVQNRRQILYLSHGGGPLPILGDASHQAMVAFMGRLPLPLHICVGMADHPGRLVFDDYILGKRGVAFLW